MVSDGDGGGDLEPRLSVHLHRHTLMYHYLQTLHIHTQRERKKVKTMLKIVLVFFRGFLLHRHKERCFDYKITYFVIKAANFLPPTVQKLLLWRSIS